MKKLSAIASVALLSISAALMLLAIVVSWCVYRNTKRSQPVLIPKDPESVKVPETPNLSLEEIPLQPHPDPYMQATAPRSQSVYPQPYRMYPPLPHYPEASTSESVSRRQSPHLQHIYPQYSGNHLHQ